MKDRGPIYKALLEFKQKYSNDFPHVDREKEFRDKYLSEWPNQEINNANPNTKRDAIS